jgi:cytidyltransferase-like protein
MKKRVWNYSELSELKKNVANQAVVLVGGCFDLFHYGHLTFLSQAKQKGDVLIVALEPDEFIQKKKKRHPIHTQAQRAELLLSHQMVDHVLLLPYFDKDVQYRDLVEDLKPDVIAVTDGDPYLENKKQFASEVRGKVHIVSSLIPEFSTTHIMSYEHISRSGASSGSDPKDS